MLSPKLDTLQKYFDRITIVVTSYLAIGIDL